MTYARAKLRCQGSKGDSGVERNHQADSIAFTLDGLEKGTEKRAGCFDYKLN